MPDRRDDPVYLDHAATTPLRPEARQAWIEATETVGNPSSIHGAGQSARRLLEESRERLAAAVDCDPVEIVFTSGGTESVNLAVSGLFRARRDAHGRAAIVVPRAEHHATLDTITWLEAHEDAHLVWVGVDEDAVVDLDAWRRAVAEPDAAVATLLVANNEIGTIQPVIHAAAACAASDVPMHLDAVGAFGHIPLSFRRLRGESESRTAGLAAMSIAAHKLGGPVGVGALVVARTARIEPLLHGGGQQRGLRAGTQDAAGAAAFATAAELAVVELAAESERVRTMRRRLERAIRELIPDVRVSAPDAERLPGHLHIVIPGAQGDSLLMLLDMAGIGVSTGSACQAGVPEPSHVVTAMGLGEDAARSALRFTLGRTSRDDDIDAVIAVLPGAVDRARAAGMSSRAVGSGAHRSVPGIGS